ncbi:unnamed protein product [Lymnaea stagnalis]|uniref:Palmitoyltransferase n=1 Tax=Lymnaea stagnalis TaxID=6523 RepID=A0AAV2HT96_LYMST
MERKHLTLKEKLTEHYQKRDFKPKKSSASTYGMIFFWTMSVSLLLEGIFILLPNHFKEDNSVSSETSNFSSYRCAQLIAIWLFLASAANWSLTHFASINHVLKETKDKYFPDMLAAPPGWKSCLTCMIDVPQRSHHCTLCNQCILKRDHHCFFTGSCVGYHNQRHFVIFCLYNCLSLLYAGYLQLTYLNEGFPIFSSAAVFYVPVVALWYFLTGATSFINIFVLTHLCLTIFCFGVSFFFLVWQVVIISRGQTSYEAWKQIMAYRRRSVLENLHSAFGNLLEFLLCLLLPVRLKMPGDGIKWTIEPKTEKGQ